MPLGRFRRLNTSCAQLASGNLNSSGESFAQLPSLVTGSTADRCPGAFRSFGQDTESANRAPKWIDTFSFAHASPAFQACISPTTCISQPLIAERQTLAQPLSNRSQPVNYLSMSLQSVQIGPNCVNFSSEFCVQFASKTTRPAKKPRISSTAVRAAIGSFSADAFRCAWRPSVAESRQPRPTIDCR